MKEATYPFARLVARKVERYLTEHRRDPPPGSDDIAPVPDAAALESIIDAAFWASLRREEGYSPKISLAYLPPARSGLRLTLEHPLPLASEELARLAPAVERPGIHLGVWRIEGELMVWGATRTVPPFCFILEVVSPSVLVIKFSRREESSKFFNFAVLESDQFKVLSPDGARQPDSPTLLKPLLAFDSLSASPDPSDALAKLAVSMRTHGHGGSLLVVPARTAAWQESMVRSLRYTVRPEFTGLADLMHGSAAERQDRLWQERLQRIVDGIAGLTAVDGATVITDEYQLLAFGVNIRRRDGAAQIEQVLVAEPLEGSSPGILHISELGGTRHLSAAQFVQDQHDAFAMVASQDGRFTVFAWSPHRSIVQAYRVETLLL